ncbi:class I adenylate-forming enzyme family protein [Winslowiella iniecta]|uniref:AMP-binding protein n=1 Tax=Winslowiella iniecta TaxID=1560201 RepID=A0A0L7TGQ9_9GAMM|nr:class I adenylate-forming enzyme family protein [Winslowiella iniecta]KOC91510.1 AMP-binding protein [Winslowiella iniecta]KOC94539.1 AMP-binding protein [Winslowiella iniecta]
MITLDKLKEIASYHSSNTCLIDKGIRYTWQQILSRATSHVAFLKKMYNNEQLRSACYLSKNNADVICWLAAFTTLGIPVNGLDYSLPVETLTTLIKNISPDMLLVSYNLYSAEELNLLQVTVSTMLAIDTLTAPIVQRMGESHTPDTDMLLKDYIFPPFRGVSLTSGTSTLPKIALRYQSFDARRFSWFRERYGFGNDDGFLLIIPLYHAAGNSWARMFMSLGSPIYLVDQDDNDEIVTALIQNNITASVMTPNLVRKLTDLVDNGGHQFHLRWILVGGSFFSVKNKHAAMNVFGPVFYEYYGCTETGVNVLSEPEDMIRYPQSVGRAFDGNQVVILDNNFQSVEAGINGRVAIASYMLMDEYSDGLCPFHVIDGVRYFLMADRGHLDREGRLFLMSRNADTNILYDLYSIEEDIRDIACISDVAVISVIENGEIAIKCIFSTKNGDKAQGIIRKIERNFKKHHIKNIKTKRVDKIPYSPSGKVRFTEFVGM